MQISKRNNTNAHPLPISPKRTHPHFPDTRPRIQAQISRIRTRMCHIFPPTATVIILRGRSCGPRLDPTRTNQYAEAWERSTARWTCRYLGQSAISSPWNAISKPRAPLEITHRISTRLTHRERNLRSTKLLY
jgi:hypothetical protein